MSTNLASSCTSSSVFLENSIESSSSAKIVNSESITLTTSFEKLSMNSAPSSISETQANSSSTSFIKQIIEEDFRTGKHNKVITRFPPEPNGYLHIGHAKAIYLNFSLVEHFGGEFHLRFDDTNPQKEEDRYIKSIKEDVKWLGGNFENHLYFTSDYFDQLYLWAEDLILSGNAYIDDQTVEEIRASRGTLTSPGNDSPFRLRSVEDNLRIFRDMKKGLFKEGQCVLRAKIDMSSGNLNLRDPILYRIINKPHPKTGDKWNIYPTYDFAHGQADSIELITHSLCSLEFETHRPLYEWLQQKLNIFKTRQIEFSKLNLSHTILSKRNLLTLVNEGYVNGWDDPRMPTIAAYRRKGYPSNAIKLFCEKIGVAKRNTVIQIEMLENTVREYLHNIAIRRFVVLKPLKIEIVNFEKNFFEEFEVPNHPENSSMGFRKLYFSSTIYIDENDFMENPTKNFHRLSPGKEVRLRYAYIIKCEEVIKNENGDIICLKCTFDASSRGGKSEDGRKIKSTIQWIDAKYNKLLEVRIINRLFTKPFPNENEGEENEDENDTQKWKKNINPNSLNIIKNALGEYSMKDIQFDDFLQFERIGFFKKDRESDVNRDVYNLTVDLLTNNNINDLNNNNNDNKMDEKALYKQKREEKAAQRKLRDQLRQQKLNEK